MLGLIIGITVAAAATGLIATVIAATSSNKKEQPTRANTIKHVYLFHYTDEQGAKGILQSGQIRPSTGQGDAAFGHGVYMTSKSPSGHSMIQIAENNYDGAWQSHVSAGRTMVAFQFKIPVTKLKEANSNRDVWLYTDGNLSLSEYHTGAIMKGSATGGYDWYLQ